MLRDFEKGSPLRNFVRPLPIATKGLKSATTYFTPTGQPPVVKPRHLGMEILRRSVESYREEEAQEAELVANLRGERRTLLILAVTAAHFERFLRKFGPERPKAHYVWSIRGCCGADLRRNVLVLLPSWWRGAFDRWDWTEKREFWAWLRRHDLEFDPMEVGSGIFTKDTL